MRIAIDDAIQANVLAVDYKRQSRLQVRDFLCPDSATAIYDSILGHQDWRLAFNDQMQVRMLTMRELAAFTPDQRSEILVTIRDRARQGYQFLYEVYPLFAAYHDARAFASPLFAVYEFLNSPGFLDFARDLTGIAGIRWADAQVTRYRAGHFLKYHTDVNPSQQRLAAYVLNFTKDWGRDWGGFLQFFDAKYDVECAFRPVFNAINIFTVPAEHSVNEVASYCDGHRLSITGWFRGDEPPPSPGR